MSVELLIILLLACKHFVVDFPLQRPYHYQNKGDYGHTGGLEHAGFHGVATAAVLALVGVPVTWVAALATLDAVLHYHIDWAKVRVNHFFKWQSHTSEHFWWLLGFDQLLHTLCYLWITHLAAAKIVV